jgi:hypothetical protein
MSLRTWSGMTSLQRFTRSTFNIQISDVDPELPVEAVEKLDRVNIFSASLVNLRYSLAGIHWIRTGEF